MIVALNVAGARPNFMKLAPVHRAMVDSGKIRPVFVHTGQHYDDNMSQIFLNEFGLGRPEFELKAGSGTHAQQTARVMERIEPVINEVRPDVVVTYGDVNSTVAAALTASKLGVPVAHVEAGLRSFDRTMPEEINRLLTDAISDICLAPSADAVENLIREGIEQNKIFLVGNVMIDTLKAFRDRAEKSPIVEKLGLRRTDYVLVTLHRPSNVDDPEALHRSVEVLEIAAGHGPVVFVAHPRTQKKLAEGGRDLGLKRKGVLMVDPLGYIDFLKLTIDAGAVLTDSGGIQEETTVLGVPCVTMRTTTERPITVEQGTNRLAGVDPKRVATALSEAMRAPREPRIPELWDGLASERIVQVLVGHLSRNT